MNSLQLFVLLIFFDNVYSFKPDYSVKKQSKSIFSNKRHTETITPARYKVGKQNIKYDRSAVDGLILKPYFPEVEYPTNIMEASKPFYFKDENNAFLTHCADEVKTNYRSALAKPIPKRVSSNIVSKNKQQPKTLTPRSILPETNSKMTENDKLPTTEEPIFTELSLDSPLQVQLISQGEMIMNKDTVKPERMISPESVSHESYEDLNVTDYPETSSIKNKTTEFYDEQVEVFYSDEVYFGSPDSQGRIPEDASVSEFIEEDYDSSPSNSSSCSSKSEEATVNPTTSMKLDTNTSEMCPLPTEKAITNTVQKAPKRLGLGPVSNVKKRKFLQQLYKTPTPLS